MKEKFFILFLFALFDTYLYAQEEKHDILFNQAYKLYEDKQYEESFPLFYHLGKEGYSKAYGYLGLAYELGEGVEVNTAQMCYWYDLAVSEGSNWCGWRLGKYLADMGLYKLALNSLKLATKNNGFKEEASFLLGKIYEDGLGVPKDSAQAVLYYKMAAKYSSSEAETALQRMGCRLYDEADFKEPTEDLIHGESSKSLFDKGYNYHIGFGCEKNYPLAYMYFKAAAILKYPKALEWMGYIATEDKYPIRSESKAKEYFDKALAEYIRQANDENADNYSDIGDFYRCGLGREVNLEEAKKWYKLGADKGNVSCQLWLGQVYEQQGRFKEALIQFEAAGRQGQGWASFLAGNMYEKGRSSETDKITPDIEKAIF